MATTKDAKKKVAAENEKVYKGIYKNKGLWRARIWNKDCEVYLGHFENKELAAKAYDKAAINLRGLETARRDLLNLDDSVYESELDEILNLTFDALVRKLRDEGVQQIH
mmetsp:Transcript_2824/g.6576  ORF Transcript_2824/g.6576 Transcript_2824/m.6576 type:complete len:109 (-) Transcript_2824:1454-1780(-)